MSQLFKNKYPKSDLFLLLNKYCEKFDKYYKLSKTAYKKAKLDNGIQPFFEELKKYYYPSKHFYLTREDNYKNFITVIRQLCKYHLVAYTSSIKYFKSKYEIIYFIYFDHD